MWFFAGLYVRYFLNNYYWLHAEALVVAGVAVTVLMLTGGVAETGMHNGESTLWFCLAELG